MKGMSCTYCVTKSVIVNSLYHRLAYSCMMVMAEGFSHAIANMTNHTSGLEQLRQGDLGQYMLPQAFNVGYVGPEGPMVFDSNGDVAKA